MRELQSSYRRMSSWYYNVASKLASSISRTYIELYSPSRFVLLLSIPFCFDTLIVATGLDDIGGGATTVLGAVLKDTFKPSDGLLIVGGKSLSRFDVPNELDRAAEDLGLSPNDIEYLKYCSRMVAKVDEAALQDGFHLYHHMMVVSRDKVWAVIQQGFNPLTQKIRRYHWFSGKVRSFVEEPHQGIVSDERMKIVLDMRAEGSREARRASLEVLAYDAGKLRKVYEVAKIRGQSKLSLWMDAPRSSNPIDYPLKVNWKLIDFLHRNLPSNYEELLSIRGVGPETVRFLSFASKWLYGVCPSFEDPAKPMGIVDQSIIGRDGERIVYEIVSAVELSDLSNDMKRRTLARLDSWLSGVNYRFGAS